MGHAVDHTQLHAGGISFLVAALILALLLSAYVVAATRKWRSKRQWSLWRTLSFAAGIGLSAIAVSPPLVELAHTDLRGHMIQHLLLGMFAPLGLVLGAPGTLMLRTVPVRMARSLIAFLDTLPIRILVHPVTALVLDIGGMYLLYLTPLYAFSTNNPVVHFLVHLHFLISGYLFVWAIAGPDPAPHRPSMRFRLIVLYMGTALHATLGKLMYAYGLPQGTPHDLNEIQAAAQLMYYGGDLAELLLSVAFFAVWFHRLSARSLPSHAHS